MGAKVRDVWMESVGRAGLRESLTRDDTCCFQLEPRPVLVLIFYILARWSKVQAGEPCLERSRSHSEAAPFRSGGHGNQCSKASEFSGEFLRRSRSGKTEFSIAASILKGSEIHADWKVRKIVPTRSSESPCRGR